jgi:hypothetical protein
LLLLLNGGAVVVHTTTPWPRPTPAGVATARGGESPRACNEAQRKWKAPWSAQTKRSAVRKTGETPCGRERAEPLRKGFCCCCSARGSALRAGTGPLRWVAKDAHFPAAAREETSSPKMNAYCVPGLRLTQRTKDMVYIRLKDLLRCPLLQWPLPGLLFGMAEGSHMRELVERTARGQCERRCNRPNLVHCAIARRTKTPRIIQLFLARNFRLTVERTPDS